ncbi:AraC family transcriptional regulator [Burkholderia sp. Ac-20379]|uniref:AraC family transcriptional regulator n=1 Tax=Burkholderia sp. Ac-20379 TaxID=2703900 RepID=UPI0019808AA9|nr:AraC family transcriptional regulator [Burkholderia sp. Ac-20379]MBN3725579.1 AraC family transcriptional regulator [Burkholderia sp. Ac-20379]
MTIDPFSDFLGLMGTRSVVSGGLTAGGAWAIRFPRANTVKFWGVVRGQCWILFEGDSAPIRIESGDVFLLSEPRSHVLGTDLSGRPVDLDTVLEGRVGNMAHHGEGDEFFMIGGKVELSIASSQLLLDALPPLIHVRGTSSQAPALRWLLDQLVRERQAALPGAHIAANQLAHLMFIQILRAHFEAAGSQPAGWLRAMGDKRLAPALQRMHDDPGRAWQLPELAQAAAMSRATFAAYFKATAGMSPLSYLTQWRMHLAQRALLESRSPVNVLAHSLGYTSESAFSNAFRRVVGCSPKHFRQRAAEAAASGGDEANRRLPSQRVEAGLSEL